MSKTLLKLILWGLVLGLLAVALWFGLGQIGQLLAYFQQGADPASAFNIVPNVPPDLGVALSWLPDDADPGRAMEPFTREQVQSAYLRAWLQWNLSYRKGQSYGLTTYFTGPALAAVNQSVTDAAAAGWQVEQSDTLHSLQLHFYSADGSIASFTDKHADVAHVFRDRSGAVAFLGETLSDYDVVMLLEDGNWRVRHIQRVDASHVDTAGELPAAQPQPGFVTRAGTALQLNNTAYPLAGINYYPQDTPWTNFWPKYDTAVIDRDFALIHTLGLNTIRIFIPFVQFGGAQLDLKMAARLDDLLARADSHNLKAIVTLFDFRAEYAPLRWPPADRQLEALVARYVNNTTILAWDLKNEPDQDDKTANPAVVDAWLAHVARLTRALDTHHLITIGWSTAQAAPRLANLVDFVSFHDYGPAAELPAQYSLLRAQAPQRPLVLEEFGLPTWNSFLFPNGHSEPEQAQYYAQMLSGLRNTDSAGYLAWTLHDFKEVPATVAGRFPWQTGPQAHLGLVQLDGSLKPAAALLAPGASLQVTQVPSWSRFLKPFWLTVFGLGAVFAWLARRIRSRRRAAHIA